MSVLNVIMLGMGILWFLFGLIGAWRFFHFGGGFTWKWGVFPLEFLFLLLGACCGVVTFFVVRDVIKEQRRMLDREEECDSSTEEGYY